MEVEIQRYYDNLQFASEVLSVDSSFQVTVLHLSFALSLFSLRHLSPYGDLIDGCPVQVSKACPWAMSHFHRHLFLSLSLSA